MQPELIETEEILIAKLRKWDKAYRKGEPLVSDREYDEEYDEAQELYPDNEFFQNIGIEIDPTRERKLDITMASMNKVKNMEELKKWYKTKNIPLDTQLVLTSKYDGLSLCVEEEINKATTRGDEGYGQSADEHYKLITNKLYEDLGGNFDPFSPIVFKYTYGEVMMRKDKFNAEYGVPNKYKADGFANPRNLVAGLINRPDPTEPLKDIAYIKYGGVLKDEFKNNVKFKHDILDLLNNGQTIQAQYKLVTFADLSEEYFLALFKEWSVDYEIDGIILEVDSLELQNKLGRERSTENPVWARAYKSPSFEQSAETEVTLIEWNISKQGLLKPRLHVRPTKLDGVTVRHATGNNARYVRDNGIGVGATVIIKRSGMVIPKVVGVTKKVDFVMPDIQNIGWNNNGVELVTLTATKEQQFKQLVSFFEILQVDEVGEGVVKQLWDAGYQTVKALLEIKPSDMEKFPGFGKRKSEIVFTEIQSKIKDVDVSKVMHGSGLFSGLGSKKLILLQVFDTKPTVEQILAIEGFAEKSAEVYLNGYDKFYNEFLKDLPITIKKVTKAEPTSDDLKDKSFCFTGVRCKDLEPVIESKGGKIASGVSKNLTYLVCKDKNAGSTKLVKAEELGVILLSVEDLQNLLK